MDTKRAVIYARFSSSRQREESIEGQVRECKAFAEHEGYTIQQIYADRAISGRTSERPEFQKMIADSKQKTFQYCIVYTFDRFSRDSYDSANYKHILKKNGVRVVSAKERTDDSPAGVLMERVFEGFAEYYSLELAQKVKRGMRLNATKGIWSSGAAPFGYAKDKEGHLVQDKKQAAALTKAFEMAAEYKPITDIASYLNMLGYRPPNASKNNFNYQSVMSMLQNPIVIGRFVWQDVVIEDYPGARIISNELFEQAQNRLTSSKRRGVVNVCRSNKYALSGKIFCGNCGRAMNGTSAAGRNKEKHYYYKCSGTIKGRHECTLPAITRYELEAEIHKKIVEVLHDKKTIATIAREAIDVANSYDDIELLAMKKRLAQAEAEAHKTVDVLVTSDTPSKMLLDRLHDLEAEVENLKEEIAKRDALIPKRNITAEMIEYFLHKMSKEPKQSLFDAMINKVIVTKKDDDEYFNVTVLLNYTPTATVGNNLTLDNIKVRTVTNLVVPVVLRPNHFEISLRIKRASYRNIIPKIPQPLQVQAQEL